MTKFTLLPSLLFLLPLATCHFQLQQPPSRAGEDDEKQATFPCGGYDDIKARTPFPLTGGSIQLQLGHDESLIEVLLGLGNNPGDGFNIVWQPIVSEEGLGPFCFQNLDVPASLNVSEGQNATIQVITNSKDSKSGLYNCADITFTKSIPGTPPPCKNGTNIRASAYSGPFTNANGTTANGASSSSSSGNNASSTTGTGGGGKSTTATSGAAPAASSSGSSAAPAVKRVSVEGGVWALLGALAMGGLVGL